MKKLILSFILASICGISSFAQHFEFSAECSSGQTLYYSVTSGTEPYTAEITYPNDNYSNYQYNYYYNYTKPTGDLTIPSSVTYYGITFSVTSIGENAFYNCNGLTSVSIPNSVTSIGEEAFYNCNGLTSVSIPNSVTSIGEEAFSRCSGLTGELTIPNSVTSIGEDAFTECYELTSVTIGNSVTSIGQGAFSYCHNLASVTMGNSVTSIGYHAFLECFGLTSITIPESVTYIGEWAFQYCSLTTINYNATNCTSMGSSSYPVFSGNNATLNIGDGVTVIPDYAFKGGDVSGSLIIPNSVTSIGEEAFLDCRDLTSVTIGNSVTSIGSSAFGYCYGLTSVNFNAINCTNMFDAFYESFAAATINIGDAVTVIPEGAFNGLYGNGSLVIPSSVTSIGNDAFNGCGGLTSVTIGNSVTYIGSSAFGGCSGLEEMTIPFVGVGNGASATLASSSTLFGSIFGTSSYDGGTQVTQYYSSNGNITYYIPSRLRSVVVTGGNLLYGAFYSCFMLTSITIPSSVTSIGEKAFYNCNGLTSVSIPNSVTSIGEKAFSRCSGLTGELTIPNSVTSIGEDAFTECYELTSVTIGNSVTSIGQGAFSYCHNLASVTMGNSVTSIGYHAFLECFGLTSITIPESVTYIGEGAFQYCNLTTINYNATNCTSMGSSYYPVFSGNNATLNIGDGVTVIPDYAFKGGDISGSLIIPNSVTSIGNEAFLDCRDLTSVTIGNSVTSIGISAFGNCQSLTSVNFNAINCTNMFDAFYESFAAATINIGESVTVIPEGAFNWLYGNGSLTIPNSVTSIGNNAFNGCEGLTSVTIGNSVSSIGSYAFYGCGGLSGALTIPSAVTNIGEGAFYACGSLRTINFNADTCVTMGSYNYPVFADCSSLLVLNIGENVTNIPAYAFKSCNSLTGTLSLSDLVVNIGDCAFYGCSGLSGTLTIPNSVTNIGESAFYGCSGFTSANIPTSVASIGSAAFSGCSGLVEMSLPFVGGSANATSGSALFGYIFGTASYTGGTSVRQYYASSNYNTYYIPSALRTVTVANGNLQYGVFYGCSMLTSVAIPSSLESIGERAFSGCSGITGSIAIPGTVTNIGQNAFYGCTNLNAVNYGGNVEQWCGITFGNANANPLAYAHNLYIDDVLVRQLAIPETITEIKDYAFYKATCLTGVTLPESLTSINSNAFYNCTGLMGELNVHNLVTNIGDSAFYNCNSLRSLTLGSGVMSIGNWAFASCSGLFMIMAKPEIPPVVRQKTFSNVYTSITVKVPCNSAQYYTAAQYWNSFTNIQASFAHTLAVSSNDPLMGYATVVQEPTCSNQVGIISATPTNGCSFASWNDGNTDNPRNVVVNADVEYIAFFNSAPTYTITVSSANTEMGSVSGGGQYTAGTSVTIVATANAGYMFSHWNDGNVQNPRTIVVTGDATYVASFTENASVTYYTITANPALQNQGTVSGGGVYAEGTVVTLTATAYSGYHFSSWSDGVTDNPRIITVTGDATYIANFAPDSSDPTVYYEFSASACGSYTWNDHTYTQSGTYTQTFTAANYADSVVTLNLTIYTMPQPQITASGVLDGCNPSPISLSAGDYSTYNWSTGATIATIRISEPGYYHVEVTDAHGCTGVSEQVNIGLSNNITNAPQILVVGMNNLNRNVVSWAAVTEGNVRGYRIYRENNVANVYEPMATVESSAQTFWTDETADPSSRAYRYKVTAVDECGGESPMSDYHKTMHLTINQGIGNAWNLIWSHYEGFDFGTYRIYRGTMPSNMTMIGEVPSNLNSYTDNTATANTGFYYQVEIVRNSRSRDAEISSRSNIVDNGYLPEYTITVMSANPNRGTVTGGGTYPAGTVVTLTAVANEGYEFSIWSDENTENPRQITVTGDAMFIASFEPAGIDETAVSKIALFPNPATDILNITSSETISEIEIVNVMGQVVKCVEVNGDNAVCDVEELKAGVYVVRIHAASATLSVRKFIKE